MRLGHRPVGRRPAAAGVRPVDDVVVQQRAGLHQLERGGHREHGSAARSRRRRAAIPHARDGAPAAEQELRPQPLATVEDEPHQLIDERGRAGRPRRPPRGAGRASSAASTSCRRSSAHPDSVPAPDKLRGMVTVRDRLAAPGPQFSVEFMPPRNDAEEDILWRAVRRLEQLRPAFVSVTYGAGGSHRDRTIRVTGAHRRGDHAAAGRASDRGRPLGRASCGR